MSWFLIKSRNIEAINGTVVILLFMSFSEKLIVGLFMNVSFNVLNDGY